MEPHTAAPEQAKEIADNVVQLAKRHGIPGEAMDGLLKLRRKDKLRFSMPRTYLTADGQALDMGRIDQLSHLFGLETPMDLADAKRIKTDSAPTFGIRLAKAMEIYMTINDCHRKQLPKRFGVGKGKNITERDIDLAINPNTRLPEAEKLRIICQKLPIEWFYFPTKNRRNQESIKRKESCEATIAELDKALERVLPDSLFHGLMVPTVMALEHTSVGIAIKAGNCMRSAETAPFGGMGQSGKSEKELNLCELPREGDLKQYMDKRPNWALSSAEIQRAIKATRDICMQVRIKEYAFFILTGLPVRTQTVNNMQAASYWTPDKVARYANVLGVTPKQILGEEPYGAATRDFGEIFVGNFEEALDDVGIDVAEVINTFSKIVNRVPSNVKKSLIQGKVMPGLDDARRLMALTGLRLEDMLDWTGNGTGRIGQLSEIELALAEGDRSNWVATPAFPANLKYICRERNSSPSNFLWSIGINDSKRRRTVMRSKSAPSLLIEKCAAELHVEPDILTGDPIEKQNRALPPGPDIGKMVCDNLNAIIARDGLQESEICALASITCYAPVNMNPTSLHERLVWPYSLMTDANESFLLALLTALQVPSLAALLHCDQIDDPMEDAGGSPPGDAEPPEQRPEPYDGARDSSDRYRKVETNTDQGSGIMELLPKELFDRAEIPERVSFALALEANMRRPRVLKPKWTVESLAKEASRYLPTKGHFGKHKNGCTVFWPQTIKEYLTGQAMPEKQYQLDAIVRAFFPEATSSTLAEYRKRFFEPAEGKAVVPNKQMADSIKHGIQPAEGAVFSTTLRKLLRVAKMNVPYLAQRMARIERNGEYSEFGSTSNFRGIEGKLWKWVWNLSADEGIEGEDLDALATIFDVPKNVLTDIPGSKNTPEIIRSQIKKAIDSMSPMQISTLYYQYWLGGFVGK